MVVVVVAVVVEVMTVMEIVVVVSIVGLHVGSSREGNTKESMIIIKPFFNYALGYNPLIQQMQQ